MRAEQKRRHDRRADSSSYAEIEPIRETRETHRPSVVGRATGRILATRPGRAADTMRNRWRSLQPADQAALTASVSLLTGVAMAIVKFAMGVWSHSMLLIATAIYYVILCSARGSAVDARRRMRRDANGGANLAMRELRVYHRTGGLMILMGLSYMLVCAVLLNSSATSRYNDIIAITIAFITVVKLSVAIRGLVTARRHRSPITVSIRAIAFVDALLSIVVMQNVLIASAGESGAGDGGSGVADVAAANVSSGCFGMALGAGVAVAGIVMLVRRRTA